VPIKDQIGSEGKEDLKRTKHLLDNCQLFQRKEGGRKCATYRSMGSWFPGEGGGG